MPLDFNTPCMASAFMMVAMMPMWSALTRSMPLAAPARPRKMLPPPMTRATCGAGLDAGDDLIGNARHRIEVNAEGLIAHQHFAGDLKKNSLIGDFAHGF